MVENKTQLTDADVIGFLENVEDAHKREDSFAILEDSTTRRWRN